jgi:hypothetical protein
MRKASGSGFVGLREISGEKSTNSNEDGGAGRIAAECGSTRGCENSIDACDRAGQGGSPREAGQANTAD